jgi:hypothetical protein
LQRSLPELKNGIIVVIVLFISQLYVNW